MHAKIIIERIKAASNTAAATGDDDTKQQQQQQQQRPKKPQQQQKQQRQLHGCQVRQWLFFLQQVKAFKEEHGHCIISKKTNANPKLVRWAKRQRYNYKQYKKYIKDNKKHHQQQQGQGQTNNNRIIHNHHHNQEDNIATKKEQQQQDDATKEDCCCYYFGNNKNMNKNNKNTPPGIPAITLERIEVLNKIGFVWDTHQVIWEERFNDLKEFYKIHGHYKVPLGPTNKRDPLATWIRQQRHEYKLYKLGKNHSITIDRIEQLNNIQFPWEIK